MYRMKDLRSKFGVKSANAMEGLLKQFSDVFPKAVKATDRVLGAREWPEVPVDELARKFREHKTNGDTPAQTFRKMLDRPIKKRGGTQLGASRGRVMDEIRAINTKVDRILEIMQQFDSAGKK